MAKTKEPSASDYIIDFSEEEEGGGRLRIKPGTYRVKIVAAKVVKSSNKGTPGLELTLAFKDGNEAKRKLKMTETLWKGAPATLRRFRLLMEALDLKVPKGKFDFTKLPARIKGEELYVEIADETDENYPTKSVVTFDGLIGLDDYDPDLESKNDEEDESGEDDEEGDEDDDEEEEESDDEDDDEEGDEDDEEEDEPVAKKKKARAKAAVGAKKGRKKKKAEDEDDDSLDLDDF